MEFGRTINISESLFKKYVQRNENGKISKSKDITSEELFFKFGFDILGDGTVIHPELPNQSLHTVILDDMVRYNPIINGVKFIFTIHRLQAYKKWKNKIFEKGIVVIHKDTDMMNNHIDNLKLGTRSERMMMIPQEQRQKASEHAASFQLQYNHDDVYAFFIANNRSYKKTQERFGIKSKSTVHGIVKKFEK